MAIACVVAGGIGRERRASFHPDAIERTVVSGAAIHVQRLNRGAIPNSADLQAGSMDSVLTGAISRRPALRIYGRRCAIAVVIFAGSPARVCGASTTGNALVAIAAFYPQRLPWPSRPWHRVAMVSPPRILRVPKNFQMLAIGVVQVRAESVSSGARWRTEHLALL